MKMIYLFWISAISLFLSYAGYPLWLLFLSLFGKVSPATGSSGFLPSVTLLISAYNEEKVIGEKIKNSLSLDYPSDKLSIVVVSDGSTDGTNTVVESFGARGVSLVIVEERRGKTHALNQVIPGIASDIVVFSDANTMYDAQAITQLATPFEDPRVGAVCGELTLHSPDGEMDTEALYWRYEQLLKRLESRTGGLTTFNGSIYAMRPALHQPMLPGAANDFQHALQLAGQKVKTLYQPEARGWEDTGSAPEVEFARRVRIISRGWRALFANSFVLNPFRVGVFCSKILLHKVLRWLGPLFLFTVLATNFLLLTQLFYQVALAAQLLFYTLALLGAAGVSFGPVRAAYYFCLINAAAFWGLVRVVAGRDSSTWVPTSHNQ